MGRPSSRRGATALALIDPAASRKLLFEATPDLPSQLYALQQHAPDDRFQLDAIFLTHAHIGHYAGLMYFGHEAMGASGINVHTMPRMLEFLRSNGPWSQLVAFENIALRPLQQEVTNRFGSISVTPFLVPHRDEYSETVGFRISGPAKTALFIPDINKWSVWEQDIVKLLAEVDYALLDATFYQDGELPGRDMSRIPHPFVTETMALFQDLPLEQRNKVWFIHMNHTNPLLDSAETEFARSQGYNIAVEGIRLDL